MSRWLCGGRRLIRFRAPLAGFGGVARIGAEEDAALSRRSFAATGRPSDRPSSELFCRRYAAARASVLCSPPCSTTEQLVTRSPPDAPRCTSSGCPPDAGAATGRKLAATSSRRILLPPYYAVCYRPVAEDQLCASRTKSLDVYATHWPRAILYEDIQGQNRIVTLPDCIQRARSLVGCALIQTVQDGSCCNRRERILLRRFVGRRECAISGLRIKFCGSFRFIPCIPRSP